MKKRGVVAVVVRENRLLVIRRSQFVKAPGLLCFPGGGIEPHETEPEALVREFSEELGALIQPAQRLWESITPWGVGLAWWLAELPRDAVLFPAEREVSEILWFTVSEMQDLPDLLASNHQFLFAWQQGTFSLPLDEQR